MDTALDPYATLGLPRGATRAQIRAAYTKMARATHPDLNRADPLAADRFSQVKEAYDRLTRGGAADAPEPLDSNNAGRDFFADVGVSRAAPATVLPVEVDLETAHCGAAVLVDLGSVRCPPCGGSGRTPSRNLRECPSCGGRGYHRQTYGVMRSDTRCAACGGSGTALLEDCGRCRGTGGIDASGTRVRACLPPGCPEGFRVPLEHHSGPRWPGRLDGEVRIRAHRRFAVEGCDLRARLDVPYWTLVLGGEARMRGVDRRTVAVPVGERSRPGAVVEIAGEGLRLEDGGRGTLRVELGLEMPTVDDPHMRRLIEEMARRADRSG